MNYFKTPNWAVTEYGLEHTGGYEYDIPADRRNEGDWQRHMADKEWVHGLEFAYALTVAIAIHSGAGPMI